LDRQYEARAAEFDASSFAHFLGMKIVELSAGYAVAEMELKEEHLNWGAIAHGGVIVSLADHASGCALNAGETNYVAVQFSTNFLAAPRAGEKLRAEAQVLRAGRKMGMTQISVKDGSGRLIAMSAGTAVVAERRKP
jgi:acyl-CoA thioesterase